MGLLDGKLAVITGGSRGIGKAIAKAYIAQGANVVIADIDLETAQSTAKELGEAAHAIQLKVADKKDVFDKTDQIWIQFGKVDIWVNNAGISQQIPF